MQQLLMLWAALLAAADAGAIGAREPAPAAAPGIELRMAEVRLLNGGFTLKLNTGWLSAHPAQDGAPAGERLVDGSLDLQRQSGHVRLGGGDERRLRLRIEWDFHVEGEMARVHSQIDFALLGRALRLSPPDVRVRPRMDRGMPGADVNLPLLEGRF